MASLGRLAAAARASGAHASTIDAHADPFTRQGPVMRYGEPQGGLKRCIPEADAGLRGGRADAHQTRHVAREAPTGEHRRRLAVARCLHHVQRDLRARGRANAVSDAQGLEHRVAPRAVGPTGTAAPPSAAAPVLAEVGRLQDKTRTTQQEDAGRTEALVDEGHWALRTRLGYGLRDKGLRCVSAS